MSSTDKIVAHLNEIHGLELALVQTLTAHIAITPRGRYRAILELHRDETREQAKSIQARLRELGVGRNPLQLVGTVANTVVGQAVAIGKAPIDLLRGGSGEEKLLKNARDEISSEALEIAFYDALEALAEGVGDVETAELARLHRTQEERAMAELRAEIKHLAQDVIDAEVKGRSSYDASRTGAADAARATGRQVRDAVRSVPGEPELEGEIRGTVASEEDLAIKNYGSLTVERILPKLKILPELELAKIDGYERQHRNRKRVLDRIRALRERQPAGAAS